MKNKFLKCKLMQGAIPITNLRQRHCFVVLEFYFSSSELMYIHPRRYLYQPQLLAS